MGRAGDLPFCLLHLVPCPDGDDGCQQPENGDDEKQLDESESRSQTTSLVIHERLPRSLP